MVARATVVVEVGEGVCGERAFVKLFRASLCDAVQSLSKFWKPHHVACLVFIVIFCEENLPIQLKLRF